MMSVKAVPAATIVRARVQATIVDVAEDRRGREMREGEGEKRLHTKGRRTSMSRED